ncbi:tyrosine-type recombinase/integrase [uncultured Draconibacterium sp.]|uniref:tyrosine-type recombinase/integrase n=1 Tax=uncultured Draconibacterium sp. TaxID=1573823 RepID=UPI0025E60825|nr:tyrosine-type recombinase/integrase [uncultured Draconibacterium sp.]
MNKTSDFIEYDIALNKGLKLLKDDKKCILGFFIIASINIGTRISDTLKLKHQDLKQEKLIIKETKTKKERCITLNNRVKTSYQKLTNKLDEMNIKYKDDDFVFVSQKGTVYRTQSINKILKEIFNSKQLQISSHSLRKSFARKIYENMDRSEHALVLLSSILSHSSVAITRIYLGLQQEIINDVYLELE